MFMRRNPNETSALALGMAKPIAFVEENVLAMSQGKCISV